jgi:hypothetical protein
MTKNKLSRNPLTSTFLGDRFPQCGCGGATKEVCGKFGDQKQRPGGTASSTAWPSQHQPSPLSQPSSRPYTGSY